MSVTSTTGATTTYSQHAYGLAIDLDPFQNPYTKGDLVMPELASSYLDRDESRPGMITPDGVVVRAFAGDGVRVTVGAPAENDAFLAAATTFPR